MCLLDVTRLHPFGGRVQKLARARIAELLPARKPRIGLDQVALGALGVVIQNAEIGHGGRISRVGRPAVQLLSFSKILGYALAPIVEQRQIEGRACHALFRGLAIPVGGFRLVAGCALCLFVHPGQRDLRHHDALVGSLAQPLGRLLRVFRHTLTAGVHQPEVVLGRRNSLFGGPLIQVRGLLLVLRNPLAAGV